MTTNSYLIEYFNDLCDTYVTNEYASFFMTNYMRRKLIKKVESYNNKSVLDIMSGKGENLKYILDYNETKITTIDYSSKMNEVARINHTEKKIHQIEADFFETNNKPESYDIILCSFGIKTIEKEKLNLFTKKINHLLKPNGEILLLELVKPKRYLYYIFTKFYLETLLPFVFGKQFKVLFPFVKNNENMDNLKMKIKNENINIIEHKRVFDLFEIIHAKK